MRPSCHNFKELFCGSDLERLRGGFNGHLVSAKQIFRDSGVCKRYMFENSVPFERGRYKSFINSSLENFFEWRANSKLCELQRLHHLHVVRVWFEIPTVWISDFNSACNI